MKRTPALDTLPITYIQTLRDQVLPPHRQQRIMASLLHIERVDLDTGHLPMLSRPSELAATLDRIAMKV